MRARMENQAEFVGDSFSGIYQILRYYAIIKSNLIDDCLLEKIAFDKVLDGDIIKIEFGNTDNTRAP